MKLIIDIPDKAYNRLLEEQHLPNRLDIEWVIIHGIPLEQIRVEIEQMVDEEIKHDEKWAIGLRYAVKIIDKYK